MKEQSEKRVAKEVQLLLRKLERMTAKAGLALNDFEVNHTEYECDQSKEYDALVAGYFSLRESIDRINNQLNN